ncbi:unnamed protein product [Orchesella dallaii]|uniref:Uncharacterized protein n=1 Tax=Orchesella dallaii TaxID=48710 RepID=A0ABP1PZV8_9HEXA
MEAKGESATKNIRKLKMRPVYKTGGIPYRRGSRWWHQENSFLLDQRKRLKSLLGIRKNVPMGKMLEQVRKIIQKNNGELGKNDLMMKINLINDLLEELEEVKESNRNLMLHNAELAHSIPQLKAAQNFYYEKYFFRCMDLGLEPEQLSDVESDENEG